MKIPFILESGLNKIIKPNLSAIVTISVDDKTKRKFYAKSFVGNFLQRIYGGLNQNSANFVVSSSDFNNSRISLKMTNGTFNNTDYNNTFKLNAGVGVTNFGLLWGTGTTAPDPLDYTMESLIGSGTGAGELSYSVQESTQGSTVNGQDTSFILSRNAVNGSGNTINVTECGLVCDTVSRYYLILRDTFTAVPVADGKTLTTTIEFKITT